MGSLVCLLGKVSRRRAIGRSRRVAGVVGVVGRPLEYVAGLVAIGARRATCSGQMSLLVSYSSSTCFFSRRSSSSMDRGDAIGVRCLLKYRRIVFCILCFGHSLLTRSHRSCSFDKEKCHILLLLRVLYVFFVPEVKNTTHD